ncbi:MAG TPA: integrase arm-type DNA-binding domain-containing protein [Steroidobacteraceae bacterium]|nr:integrase arm-type DNA-binding domain-containing protein [Steroidobacteraceae bacterium]
MPPLSETRIKSAKPHPEGRQYKVYDERGLYLLVTPGGRWWRFKYRLGGREKGISLGTYPDVSLKRAREKRDEARRLVADGLDPSDQRRAAKDAQADTFKAIAEEWLPKQQFSDKTLEKARWTLDDLIYPYIGSRPVRQITAPEVLDLVRRLEARGKHETAHRTKQRIGQVLRYAIATGRAERDVTADLRGALTPIKVTNHAAVTEPALVGELLRAIDAYSGQPAVEYALKLAPLLFVRPGELRAARWEELRLEGDEPEWRIPAERMKMREYHVVPLARQAVALLRDLQPITGPNGMVFPNLRDPNRPLSEVALTAALRRMGYSGEQMTWHGFRTIASTLLNEQGWHPDLIELQLAHQERNKVRAAYNRAQRLDERRKMMQAWADYLERLKATKP